LTAAGFSLTGKTALVTGAARGLGWKIAQAMARAGAHVLINGRDGDRLDTLAAELGAAGFEATAACFDVADPAARNAWLGSHEGRIDILVNNVGARHRKPIAECPPDDFAAMLDVNLTAAFALSRQIAPAMAAAGGGAIVNITSIAGPLARAGDAAYTAAKGGLAALTRALAVELGPAGVRCNAVAPGYFATEINQAMVDDPDTTEFLRRRVPLRRWGEPAEIAGAVVFLASPAASYVNGHILTVDGGLSVSF